MGAVPNLNPTAASFHCLAADHGSGLGAYTRAESLALQALGDLKGFL